MQFFIPFIFSIRSIRLAIKYIKHLQYLLSFSPGAKIPPHIVEFDAALPAWIKNPAVPGATLSQMEIDSLENGAVYTLPPAAEENATAIWVAASGGNSSPTAESGEMLQQQQQQQQLVYDGNY